MSTTTIPATYVNHARWLARSELERTIDSFEDMTKEEQDSLIDQETNRTLNIWEKFGFKG